ncbi:torsin-1A-interacting protein [Mactra antiquata]
MSDEEFVFDDSPSLNTRSKEYCRRPLPPIADRMSSKNKNDSRPTRSPNHPRTSRHPSSPKSTRKSPRVQRKEGQKTERIYPNLNISDDDYDEVDTENSEVENENDSSLNDEKEDYRESGQKSTRTRFRMQSNKPNNKVTKIYPNLDERKDLRLKDTDNRGKKNDENDSSIGTYIFIFIFFVAVGYGLYAFLQTPRKDSIEKTQIPPSLVELFESRFSKIKTKYPSQTKRFWRIVGSQIKRLLTDEENYPAVLLLAIPEKFSSIGSCFSSDVVSALNDVFNSTNNGYVDINTLISVSDDGARVKLALDNKLMANLEKGRGVVLDHVEMLPAQAALLLHGYCDGDNAPYKRSVIFLGLHTNDVKQDQHDLDDILNTLWLNELGEDEMPALRSRIGNNVVVLNQEQNFKCQ